MAESFEKLQAWLAAKELCLFCYQSTKLFPKEEQFALTNQIRRAAISVISNIAEAMSRSSIKDRKHFLDMAVGSVYELKAQMIVSFELKYLNKNNFEKNDELCCKCLRLINGYKNYLK